MLARLLAATGRIDRFGAVGRGDNYRLAAQDSFNPFKKLCQSEQVCQRYRIWRVVQRPVVGDGEFGEAEVFS